MSGLSLISRIVARRYSPFINRRLVSTSPKKNTETPATSASSSAREEPKNWVSYGYDKYSKETDRNAAHSGLFGTVTLCLVFGAFVLAYMPDYNLRDWAVREAFLELRRREDECLPLIDPNLIDPKKIQLPSDEELGDTQIII